MSQEYAVAGLYMFEVCNAETFDLAAHDDGLRVFHMYYSVSPVANCMLKRLSTATHL